MSPSLVDRLWVTRANPRQRRKARRAKKTKAFPNDLSFSSQFNRALVVNDDNRIPYQVLREEKPGGTDESGFVFKDIEAFVAPLAEKIFLPAESFQKVVTTVLGRGDVGYKSLSERLATAPLVLRLFLTTARSFKKRLGERGMGNTLVPIGSNGTATGRNRAPLN